MKCIIDAYLAACKMNKTDLARELGVNRASVYRWHEGAPLYAVAYLKTRKAMMDLLEDNKKMRELLKQLQEFK